METNAAERPHIVLILADDMGFSDLGCFGGEIETPHLDSLAAGGVRFTQFDNSPRCSPTRASLLTGLHPHQVGIGILAGDERPAYDNWADRVGVIPRERILSARAHRAEDL